LATVEELDYELNFKWDKKTFEGFNKSLQKSVAGFVKLGAAIIAAQGVAFSIAKSVADQNDQLDKLALRLNTTTEEYQRLKFAAEDFGASGEDVTSSLKNLTKAQEDILRGKGDIEAFGRLGINPADFQNSSDLLLAISDSIQNIQSNSEKINLLERIGVSTNLLQALDSGSANINKLGQRFKDLGGVVTEEQKRLAGDFQTVWLDASTVINGIMGRIGSNLLVSINKFLAIFVKFAVKNMKEITAGFDKFFRAITKASDILFFVLGRIFSLISDIVGLMGGLENAVIVASAAFLVLKRRMVLAFAVPLALGLALFLIIEDIIFALSKKDSITGGFLDTLGIKVESILEFANNIKGVFEIILGQLGSLVNFWISSFEKILEIIKSIGAISKDISLPSFGDIGSSISGFFGGTPQGQAITNNVGGARNANVTINVSGADGSVVEQINQYFQQTSNRIFGD